MTKEQINKLETEIETIVTNNAKQIIESGLTSIAKYFIDNRLVDFNLIDVNNSNIKDYLIAHYNYLPFDEYIKYYYQTVCAFIDTQSNEVIDLHLCDTNKIIEVFEQRHDCKCALLPANYLNNNEDWVKELKDAEITDYITGILRVTTDCGTNYIALYNEMMR